MHAQYYVMTMCSSYEWISCLHIVLHSEELYIVNHFLRILNCYIACILGIYSLDLSKLHRSMKIHYHPFPFVRLIIKKMATQLQCSTLFDFERMYEMRWCRVRAGPTQLVRLVRFWPDQYLEVTSKICFGLLREGSSFEESVTAPSII